MMFITLRLGNYLLSRPQIFGFGFFCALVFGGCGQVERADPPPPHAPTLTYLSARRAVSGDLLALAGTGITHPSTSVLFGHMAGEIERTYKNTGADDSLYVRIPMLSPGAYELTVSHDGGRNTLINALEVVAPREDKFVQSQRLGRITKEQVIEALAQLDLGDISIEGFLQHDIALYRMTYRTQLLDQTVLASALVILPDSALTVDMIAINHGTIVENREAPTEAIQIIQANEGIAVPQLIDDRGFKPLYLPLLLSYYASMGYAIVQPDYVGFGSTSDLVHPYLIASTLAANVVDALEATYSLVDPLESALTGRVFLTGYSLGAYVTVAALRALEQRPVDGLEVQLTIAGGGLYDPSMILDFIIANPTRPLERPAFVVHVFHSYLELFNLTLDYEDIFQAPYAMRIPLLFDKKTSGPAIDAQLTSDAQALFTADFLADYPDRYTDLSTIIDQNRLYRNNWRPRTPLRLYHSPTDELIPYQSSAEAKEDLSKPGVTLLGNTYEPSVVLQDLVGSHVGASIGFYTVMIQDIILLGNQPMSFPLSN